MRIGFVDAQYGVGRADARLFCPAKNAASTHISQVCSFSDAMKIFLADRSTACGYSI